MEKKNRLQWWSKIQRMLIQYMLAILNQFDSYAFFCFVKITINMAIILIYNMNNIMFSSAVSITIIYFAPIYLYFITFSSRHSSPLSIFSFFALLTEHSDMWHTLLSRIQCESKEKYLFSLGCDCPLRTKNQWIPMLFLWNGWYRNAF